MSKIMKRKQSSHVVCIDPTKKGTQKKATTKADLVQEKKELKSLNEALNDENKNNMKKISLLEEKLSSCQDRASKVQRSQGSQTDDADLLFCEECEFPAETLYELGEHVGEFHTGLRIPCDFCSDIYVTHEEKTMHEIKEHKSKLSNYDPSPPLDPISQKVEKTFTCKFCNNMFKTKHLLMKHSREEHEENTSKCWNFQSSECEYQDNCWFSHEKEEKDPIEFKCKSCEKNFKTKSEYLKHKKSYHTEMVPSCKRYVEGNCIYDDHTCWFIHHKTDNMNKNDGNERNIDEDRIIVKRLIEMVEKLTKRIVEIEKN